jgi:hypothetical protein
LPPNAAPNKPSTNPMMFPLLYENEEPRLCGSYEDDVSTKISMDEVKWDFF